MNLCAHIVSCMWRQRHSALIYWAWIFATLWCLSEMRYIWTFLLIHYIYDHHWGEVLAVNTKTYSDIKGRSLSYTTLSIHWLPFILNRIPKTGNGIRRNFPFRSVPKFCEFLCCKFILLEDVWPIEDRYVPAWALSWIKTLRLQVCSVALKWSILYNFTN